MDCQDSMFEIRLSGDYLHVVCRAIKRTSRNCLCYRKLWGNHLLSAQNG
jgi:hypothetical protein